MKLKKYASWGLLSLLLITIIAGTFVSLRVKSQVKELFKMNKHLQEEGYYMGEFEFHMVGFGYLIGKGHYLEALKGVSKYHAFLSNKENLIKIPNFKSKQDEIDFYLNLQNPETGAFMDSSAPFCTYFSNTENMVMHLEALQDSTSKPLQLKYPLSFLDNINTPQKLEAYLNDISYMNRLGSKFPQTSFHFARDMFSNIEPDNVIERNNLYHFTPEWKQTILQWMYNFQDAETGLWGPKHTKTKELLKFDINNSYSIVKKFRDTNGEDIYEEFPLRYGDKLFRATLEGLKVPMPADDELEWVHEWNLNQAKGIKMLLACLWKDASDEDRKAAKDIIANFIKVSFDKYYVADEGAFSYYPNSAHATVDGMNNMILKRIGALSYARQKRYWGAAEANAKALEPLTVDTLAENDLEEISNIPDINSWRIYCSQPDFKKLYNHVSVVYYPTNTKVLDITELVPNIIQWTETSTLSTGNWKSMADITNEYSSYHIQKPLIYREKVPYEDLNQLLEATSELYIIGFDILQIPRFIQRITKENKTNTL
ncbi:hypothetical protein [Mangrovimonas sp. TPBH4]|uniref:hypothetical protein n=1 Tax=Mangrovimonas sp. TPBH4 TaxID=1645914 RepID=UPI0006B68560|nr:hypothetical protein [Mangrovimonas sp. TPBH4]